MALVTQLWAKNSNGILQWSLVLQSRMPSSKKMAFLKRVQFSGQAMGHNDWYFSFKAWNFSCSRLFTLKLRRLQK